MKRPIALTRQSFSHPLLGASIMVCAAFNVGQAGDNPLCTKSAQLDSQPPAFDIQPGFARDWVPSFLDGRNFGGQFRVLYEETRELGNIEFSATPFSANFMPALIESDKELIGPSPWMNFQGIFAAARLRYDIDSLWLTDGNGVGVDSTINSYNTQEIDLPAEYGIKRSTSVWDRIAPSSPGDYIKSSVSGADRAWYHRVAYPQINLKF